MADTQALPLGVLEDDVLIDRTRLGNSRHSWDRALVIRPSFCC